MAGPGVRLAVLAMVWGFSDPGLVIGRHESEDIGGNACTSPWISSYNSGAEFDLGSRFA